MTSKSGIITSSGLSDFIEHMPRIVMHFFDVVPKKCSTLGLRVIGGSE